MNTGKGDPDFDIIQKTFMLIGIKYTIETTAEEKIISLISYNEDIGSAIIKASLVFTKEGQYIKTY